MTLVPKPYTREIRVEYNNDTERNVSEQIGVDPITPLAVWQIILPTKFTGLTPTMFLQEIFLQSAGKRNAGIGNVVLALAINTTNSNWSTTSTFIIEINFTAAGYSMSSNSLAIDNFIQTDGLYLAVLAGVSALATSGNIKFIENSFNITLPKGSSFSRVS